MAMTNNAYASPPKTRHEGVWSFASKEFAVQLQIPGCSFQLEWLS